MQGPSIADRLAAAKPVTCGTCMATPMSPGRKLNETVERNLNKGKMGKGLKDNRKIK